MSKSPPSEPVHIELRHTDLGRLLRDALIHLHDLPYLQTHPLTHHMVHQPGSRPATRGKFVQQRLVQAIEELRPGVQIPVSDRTWRRYHVLALRYLEGLEISAICQRLGISQAGYFRELRQGLEAITSILGAEFGQIPEASEAVPLTALQIRDSSVEELQDPAHRSDTVAAPLLAYLPARTPLVGRAEEWDFLKAQYEAVAAGAGGRLILVSGDPGVGKTRLAQELGRFAERQGGMFTEGRYVRAGVPPYRVWVEALRPTLRELSQEELAAAVGSHGSELVQIFPELNARLGPFPPMSALDPEEQRFRLYDGIVEMLRSVSQHQPLILLLDDLQWAPALTLLDHVAHHLGECRALLIGTYREQEFNERPNLVRERDDLHRARLFTLLALRPLDQGQTAQMVAHHLGGAPASQLREQVYRTTRGNPFFVEEVLRSLVESGAVHLTVAGWEVRNPSAVYLPESVKRVIVDRVARLGKVAHDILVQAAVLGPEFSLAALGATTGLTAEQLLECLDRAMGSRLLVDRSAIGDERYAFADDQVQEVLYESIPPALLRRYHRRAGQALEGLYADRLGEHARQLAWHFGHGTEREDLVKAVRYAEEAARQAVAVYSYREAVAQLERAAAWQKALDPGDIAKRCDLLLALGEALMPAGEPLRVAEDVAPEALRLAEALGDHERAAYASQIALRAFYRYGGVTATGTASYHQWVERVDRYTSPETAGRVWADDAVADAAWMAGRYAEASTRVRQALALARRLGEPEGLFTAAFKALNLLAAPREQEQRRQLADEVRRWPRTGVSANTLHLTLSESAIAMLEWGGRDQAEALWREIAELGQRTLEPPVRLRPLLTQMTLQLFEGNLEAAVETGARLVALSDDLGSPVVGRQFAAFSSLRPLLYLGQEQRALALLEQWEQLAGAQHLRLGAARHGLVLAHLGRFEEAGAVLHRMLTRRGNGAVDDATPWPLAATLLEVAVLLQDRECATVLATYLAELAGCYHSRLDISMGRLLGAAAGLRGDLLKAQEYYEQALALAMKLGHRPEIALVHLELAEVLARQFQANEHRDTHGDLRGVDTMCKRAKALLDVASPELQQMNMRPALEYALRCRAILSTAFHNGL